jgi:DnaK suppressor protein
LHHGGEQLLAIGAERSVSLTPEQRKQLEHKLHEERDRLSGDLNRVLREASRSTEQDRSGDLSVAPYHPADLGTDTMQTELEASNATRASRELADIDDALERLRASPAAFGICEDTHEQIPFERLMLIPWARTCRDANA